MNKIYCIIFSHWWKEIFFNPWGLCSERVCKICGRKEEITAEPHEFGYPIYNEIL